MSTSCASIRRSMKSFRRIRRSSSSPRGFSSPKGPVWIRDGGYLLFSDPNANTIYKYEPERNAAGELSVFRKPSGYSGADIAEYGQPGSNGLTLDPQGRLTINEHGNRRVTRLEKNGCDRAGGPVRGQAAEQSERSGLPLRRNAVLH